MSHMISYMILTFMHMSSEVWPTHGCMHIIIYSFTENASSKRKALRTVTKNSNGLFIVIYLDGLSIV